MGFPKSGTRTTRARVVLNSQNPRIADLSGGPGGVVACLELFAQALEEDVADGGRNDGDGKVLDREDVNQGDGEPLTWAIGEENVIRIDAPEKKEHKRLIALQRS
jgi:hypothetical protein